VPLFFNRTGPGMYENGKNIEKLSVHETSKAFKFPPTGLQ